MPNKRAVEALAQLLYDTSDPQGILFPWSQRLSAVRGPWVSAARDQLVQRHQQRTPAAPPDALEGGRVDGRGTDERAVLDSYRKHGMGQRPLSLSTLNQEAGLKPLALVCTLFDLIDEGLIDEMEMFSGFEDQPTFRLLAAGRAVLPVGEMVTPAH